MKIKMKMKIMDIIINIEEIFMIIDKVEDKYKKIKEIKF